jgi:ribosome recycling factor
VSRGEEKLALPKLAQIYVKEGTTLVVRLHDAKHGKDVERALRESPLGLNPQRDADDTLLLPMPTLTQEGRVERIKQAAKIAETLKSRVRAIRRDAVNDTRSFAQDDHRRVDKDVTRLHETALKRIDEALEAKKKEIHAA